MAARQVDVRPKPDAEAIVRDLEPYAWSLARRFKPFGRIGGDEQDVMQEAMIAAWLAVEEWGPRRSDSEIAPYVMQRMEFRVIDYLRLGKRGTATRGKPGRGRADRDAVSLEEMPVSGSDMTLETVLDRERLGIVVATVQRLHSRQRRRLAACANGLSNTEQAVEEGCSQSTVEMDLWLGRKAIRLALAA